jgi:hypothetical protein
VFRGVCVSVGAGAQQQQDGTAPAAGRLPHLLVRVC